MAFLGSRVQGYGAIRALECQVLHKGSMWVPCGVKDRGVRTSGPQVVRTNPHPTPYTVRA